MGIFSASKTAASNTSFEGSTWAEGWLPSSVNNSGRALIAGIKKWQEDMGGALTSGGSANSLNLTTNSVITSLVDGIDLGFVALNTNTAACTLNVDTLGQRAIRKITETSVNDTALEVNDIRAGGHYIVRYDASANAGAGAWLLLNPTTRGGSLSITATGTTTPRTLANRFADDVASVEDFRGTNGDFTDTATINAAIAAFNAGGQNLTFPDRVYQLEALIDPITASSGDIEGQGGATVLRFATGLPLFTDIGTFFRFGTTSVITTNVTVRGFRFHLQTDILAGNLNVFAIRFDNATQCSAEGISTLGIAGLMKYGTDTTFAVRCGIRNWTGTCNQGINSDSNILIRNGAAGYVRDVLTSGNGASTNGAMLRIAPPAGASVDTLWVDQLSTQIFSGAIGKPYGVYIDRTLGDVTNLWFDSCVFDHTNTAAFYFNASTGASTLFTRLINVANCRFSPDAGKGIVVDSTAAGITSGIKFIGNAVQLGDNSPAFELKAPGQTVDVSLIGNSFLESGSSIVKDKAVILNGKGWTCIGNRVGTNQTVNKWTTAFNIEGADSDDFTLGLNTVPTGVLHLVQPAYTAASTNRHIMAADERIVRRATTSPTRSSTTPTDVTGMSVTVKANTTYRVQAVIRWRSSLVTVGAYFAFSGPSGGSQVSRWNVTPDQGSDTLAPTPFHRRVLNSGGTTTSVDTANLDMMATGEMLFTNGATAGSVAVSFASEGGGWITVMAGSVLIVEEIF